MAVAERFWSPQSDRDVADMYRRLRLASLELEDVGLTHRSGPQKLRRNLLGTMHPDALDLFAAVLEPVSFGDREDTQHTDSYTTLDRLVDAVVADPPARQDIAGQVDEIVAHGPGSAAEQLLRQRFEAWQQASPLLETWAVRNGRLSDAGDRARQLGQLAESGLEALAFLDMRTRPPAGWADGQKAVLADSQKPSAYVKFVFLPALQKLVDAASSQSAP
jgi:hexosaminidase